MFSWLCEVSLKYSTDSVNRHIYKWRMFSSVDLCEDLSCFQCTIDPGCSLWLYLTDFFTRWESLGGLLSSRGQKLMPSFVWICLCIGALLQLWSSRTEETLEDNSLYVHSKASSFSNSLPFCIHNLLFLLSGSLHSVSDTILGLDHQLRSSNLPSVVFTVCNCFHCVINN